MTRSAFRFERVVVRLGMHTPPETMSFAANLARLLQLDLFGLFVEDARLRSLAGLPFLREFRSLGGGWHPIDTARLSHELELSRRSVERAFIAAAKGLKTASRFEVMSGTPVDAVATYWKAGDLAVIGAPMNGDGEASPEMAKLIDEAFRSAVAVVLMPAKAVRVRGPVAVIADGPDDPALRLAGQVADMLGEHAVVLAKRPEGAAGAKAPMEPAEVMRLFGPLCERMVVVRRAGLQDAVPQALLAARRVPVLVVDGQDIASTAISADHLDQDQ